METINKEIRISTQGECYWEGNGANQELYNQLYDELVPASGASTTLFGEALRAASRLSYEYANNGNGNALECREVEEEIPYYDEDEEYEPEIYHEFEVSGFYQAFIDLINEVFDTYLSGEDKQNAMEAIDEVWNIVTSVTESYMENSINHREFFSERNFNAYDRVIDYVLLVWDKNPESRNLTIPEDYKNK